MSMTTTKKRKDVDGGFNDEFSDFPLSSPAVKSRRLDIEQLPPIVEGDQAVDGVMEAQGVKEEEEVEESSRNEERAVILYKPLSLHCSPSSFSISVYSDFVSGFKSKLPWSNDSFYTDQLADEAAEHDRAGQCRAVVPWVPSPVPLGENVDVSRADTSEQMDVVEEATMDVEDENVGNGNSNTNGVNLCGGIEPLHPWQKQHCIFPQQFSQNNPTPVSWFW